jgi:hypothetical protein
VLNSKYPGMVVQKGPKYRHLACDIVYDMAAGVVEESQTTFILELLKANKVTGKERNPARTTLLTAREYPKLLNDAEHSQFRSVLQGIGYIDTRCDVAFVVSHLQSESTQQDLRDLWHLLRYLNGLPHLPLVYKPNSHQLRGYCDASFALHPDQRSQFGTMLFMGDHQSSPISYKTGKIKAICRSSCETEITSVNEIVSEVLWSIDLLSELGYPQQSVEIFQDNESCITLMQKEKRNYAAQSRHIRIKWAFYTQEYKKGTLFLSYCPTEEMLADLLTKNLSGKIFRQHVESAYCVTLPSYY